MGDIKFGLKLWSTNTSVLKEAQELIERGIFHYIELLMVPNTDISPFQALQVPYAIHVPHDHWDVNIAESSKMDRNRKILQDCIAWANALKALYIVLHPGFGELKGAAQFFKGISDKRILIENMPKVGIHDEKAIGSTKKEMQELMGGTFGFCMDFGHAIKAATSAKQDYKDYIRDLLEMNPSVYHLSGGEVENEKDEHLNIEEGNYDIAFLLSCIQKSNHAHVTLETPRKNTNSLKEDEENMKRILAFL